ncbi:MAG: UxaA family hydrolase [Candidatus Sumerlaeia bacterium]
MIKFQGYARQDGRVGIRNYIAVIPASVCAAPLVSKLALQHDELMSLAHTSGCCQLGKDFSRTTEVLTRLATHPNVGAVLWVGLGCEGTPSEEVVETIRQSGRPVRFIHIQQAGGSEKAYARAETQVSELREELKGSTVTCDADMSNLVVGLECGGSDATSGLAANPAIGWVTDRVVREGGKVILSETTELLGAEHVITRNVRDEAVRSKIIAAVKRVEARCRESGVDIRGSQPTPGNIEGGLSTIEEKSMGCVYKAGTTPPSDYLDYGEPVRQAGLSFMDTPGQDVESMTGMAAGGATLFLFSTGRGSPVGFPIVPTIKITGNAETYKRMAADIDVDASGIIRGEGIADAGSRIYETMQGICRGEKTCSEETGYHAVSIASELITL